MKSLLFSFDGRIGRKSWWLASLGLMAVAILLQVIVVGLGFVSETLAVVGAAVAVPVFIGIVWPALALQAKRWHDLDKSAWWILINLVPGVGGLIALVMLGFMKGTEGQNQFGADPVPESAAGNLRTA
jgi:uncharacterized membrane protein YhaH (DUF805 family)